MQHDIEPEPGGRGIDGRRNRVEIAWTVGKLGHVGAPPGTMDIEEKTAVTGVTGGAGVALQRCLPRGTANMWQALRDRTDREWQSGPRKQYPERRTVRLGHRWGAGVGVG